MTQLPEILSTRDKVHIIEAEMKRLAATSGSGFTNAEVPIFHHPWGGVYCRVCRIPKGALVVGEIHKYANMNFLLEGDLSVLVDDMVQRMQAVQIIKSLPGTKRIAFAHTDVTWATFLPTQETDPTVIERLFIAKNEADYQQFLQLALVELPSCPS